MQITNIADKNFLNDFAGSQKMSQFLQSYEWGVFQEKVSGKVYRLGVLEADKLIASALIITKDLPIGKKYFYCPRGPIIDLKFEENNKTGQTELINIIFSEIGRLAEEAKVMFLRFEPYWEWTKKYGEGKFGQAGDWKFIKTHNIQPAKTLYLDLTMTEDELLKEMHQKTRYNINLALKKGVKVVQADKSRFEEFWSLLDQTGERDKFRPHGRNYYYAAIELGLVNLSFAEYGGRPIATALVSSFGDTATYLHGGSLDQERNIMAPYLLQWQAIKWAKSQGKNYYDFHGIDEVKWPGVTRFKKGFGGFEVNYPGTFDLVYDQGWYSIYKMVRKARRTF